jgi:hypothetical protein
MKTRTLAAALLFAFTPVSVGAPAFAQQTDDPSVKAARARFNEGVEFFDKGQYENARAAFLQAYALRKHPAVLLNLAQSSLRSGHSLEASKYFQQYLHDSTSLTSTQRGDAEKGLADARSKLGRIEVSAPTGAEITVDGDRVGTAPLTDLVDVEPGTHTIKANSDAKTLTVAGGQQVSAKFGPAPSGAVLPTPPPPTSGATDTPGDGSTSPTSTDQGSTSSTPVTADVHKQNLLAPPQSMAPVWVGIGIGAAGFATAILFAVFKSKANDSYTSIQTEIRNTPGHPSTCVGISPTSRFAGACSTLNDDYNTVNTDAAVANVGLAVGIVGAAFGLGWYLFAKKRDDSSPTQGRFEGSPPTIAVTPILGPHNNGLSMTGTF